MFSDGQEDDTCFLHQNAKTAADTRSGEWRDYTFDDDGLGYAGQNGGGHNVGGGGRGRGGLNQAHSRAQAE